MDDDLADGLGPELLSLGSQLLFFLLFLFALSQALFAFFTNILQSCLLGFAVCNFQPCSLSIEAI